MFLFCYYWISQRFLGKSKSWSLKIKTDSFSFRLIQKRIGSALNPVFEIQWTIKSLGLGWQLRDGEGASNRER